MYNQMSGSRLGRGRGGRLAVYGGCGVVVILLVFLYRAVASEMARLRELHVQCAHQQEALATQLQVIFEYKVRLEKSLAEEKSSNAAVKQELQQRASREKSLRDKDSIEAMQRFNSLQQTHKILQTEHEDLQEECKKREKQALEDTKRLEATLWELRSTIKHAQEDKDKSLQHLKNKYMELENEKTRIDDKYNELVKNNGNTEGTIDHLKKEVLQLQRELDETKRTCRTSPPDPSSSSLLQPLQQSARPVNIDADRSAGVPSSIKGPPQQQQHQQVSPPNNDDEKPQPLHAPRMHHALGDALSNEHRTNDDTLQNEEGNNVGFAPINGNIVPVALNDIKEQAKEPRNSLPLPYSFRDRQQEGEEGQDGQEEDDDKLALQPPSRDNND